LSYDNKPCRPQRVSKDGAARLVLVPGRLKSKQAGVDCAAFDAWKAAFYRTYVDSGVIADAQKRGVTTLLLAPARGEGR
jgi:hypothetical protein